MARVDWDLQATWDDQYGAHGVRGYVACQTDAGRQPIGTLSAGGHKSQLMKYVDWYLARGVGAGDKVLLAGAALGYTVDLLAGEGVPFVVGLDSSPYIHSHPDRSGNMVTVDNDLARGQQIRASIRQAFGSFGFSGNNRDPDWVITEAVLESYDDADANTILAACVGLIDGPDAQIVHLVTTLDSGPWDPPGTYNEKTLADWAAMAPTHTWIESVSGVVAV